jgi:hypothetical protein
VYLIEGLGYFVLVELFCCKLIRLDRVSPRRLSLKMEKNPALFLATCARHLHLVELSVYCCVFTSAKAVVILDIV